MESLEEFKMKKIKDNFQFLKLNGIVDKGKILFSKLQRNKIRTVYFCRLNKELILKFQECYQI